MRLATWLIGLTALTAALGLTLGALPAQTADKASPKITWKKIVLDKTFRSEGVAVADVNKDGKLDVLNGEMWYEAPDWKPHAIRAKLGNFGDGQNGYSHSFACWAEDINKDGWPDLIVIDFPGAPCYWFENPKGKDEPWKQHEIWHSACNETPQYVDLFGNGQRVLVMGWQPAEGRGNEGAMAYFTPGKDPTQRWEPHPISELPTLATFKVTEASLKALAADKVPEDVLSRLDKVRDKSFASYKAFQDGLAGALTPEQLNANRGKLDKHCQATPGKDLPGTQRFSHGLGVADLNGDGKLDVICTGGWWEQPAKVEEGKPWKFHPAPLGEACADMYTVDIDGDGRLDVLSSSAHKYGIWAHLQRGDKNEPTFKTEVLFKDLVSETHAMHFVDIDGDGLKDMVTGKRFWSHGRSEPGSDKGAFIYWFKAVKKGGLLTFEPNVIDEDSGIGTQFAVQDINGDGLLDIIVSNKKGTHVILQQRDK
jgi:hypothetical protein